MTIFRLKNPITFRNTRIYVLEIKLHVVMCGDSIKLIFLQMQMKKQDQDLASQFLRIRKTIYNLKLEWSCMDHQCMLEDAETDMDTIEELRRVTDLPVPAELDLSLIEKGFTKFNMATRRYSLA